jgi:hypothetical protein
MRLLQHYEHRDGFRAIVCAWKGGRMRFARSPIDSPVFPTREWAEDWVRGDHRSESRQHGAVGDRVDRAGTGFAPTRPFKFVVTNDVQGVP